MLKVKCDKCQAVCSTDKGFCPDCGGIYVPPYALVDDTGRVKYSTSRDDLKENTRGRRRRRGGLAVVGDEEATAVATEDGSDESSEVSLNVPARVNDDDFIPGGDYGFMRILGGLGYFASMGALIGGPSLAFTYYRDANMSAAIIISCAFVLLAVLLAMAGAACRVLADVAER